MVCGRLAAGADGTLARAGRGLCGARWPSAAAALTKASTQCLHIPYMTADGLSLSLVPEVRGGGRDVVEITRCGAGAASGGLATG